MEAISQTTMTDTPGELPRPAVAELLVAPSIVTDGAGRALVLYQRLIESGFDTVRILNGA